MFLFAYGLFAPVLRNSERGTLTTVTVLRADRMSDVRSTSRIMPIALRGHRTQMLSRIRCHESAEYSTAANTKGIGDPIISLIPILFPQRTIALTLRRPSPIACSAWLWSHSYRLSSSQGRCTDSLHLPSEELKNQILPLAVSITTTSFCSL